MSTFAYTAFDSKGKVLQGSIVERSWTQAIRRVKEMGLFPTSVKEQTQRAIAERLKRTWQRTRPATKTSVPSLRMGRVPAKALTAFTRQLATMIDAGIPLLRGLRAIEQQEENRALRKLIHKVGEDIEGGSTLSESFARHPRVFNRLYVNMIVAGESAGMLESSLARLSDFRERSQKIRSKIVSSLVYPAAVIFVAAMILVVLAVWVIPKFKEVFADLTGGQPLPLFTQFVLGSSQCFKDHLLYFIGFVVAVVAIYKSSNKTKAGRLALDRFKLRLPVIGKIIRKATICRFTRTLGTMLQCGVPVLKALTIARETADNALFARAIQRTHDSVKEGDTLTSPLQASGIFPSTVISMIDAGEQTGALPEMLLKVADNYEDEVDNAISAALSLLEPVLIVFLAIVVGSIVIAMFLPILGILDPHGGGGDGGLI